MTYHLFALFFVLTIIESGLMNVSLNCQWTPEVSICEYFQLTEMTVGCRLHSLLYCVCDHRPKVGHAEGNDCTKEGTMRQSVKSIPCIESGVCCPDWSNWSECNIFEFFGKPSFDLERYRFRKCPCPSKQTNGSSSRYFFTIRNYKFACYEVESCHTPSKTKGKLAIDANQRKQAMKPTEAKLHEERNPIVKPSHSKKIVQGTFYMAPVINDDKEEVPQPLKITTIVLVMIFCCFALIIIVALTIISRMRRARHRQLHPPERSAARSQGRELEVNSQLMAPGDVATPSLAVAEWLGNVFLPTAEGEAEETGGSVPECFVTCDGTVHVRKPPSYDHLPTTDGLPKYSFQSSSSPPHLVRIPTSHREDEETESINDASVSIAPQPLSFTPPHPPPPP